MLEPALRNEIIAHAREAVPEEACGLIAGRGGKATRIIRCPNVALDRERRYLMDGDAVWRALKSMAEAGEEDAVGNAGEPLGIYHSHVRSGPIPSATDRAEARWPFSFYVLVSVRWDEPEILAFWIENDKVTNVALGS